MRTRYNDMNQPEVWDEGAGEWRLMSEAETQRQRIHNLVESTRCQHEPISQRFIEHDEAFLDALLQRYGFCSEEDLRAAKRIAKAYTELMFKRHCR